MFWILTGVQPGFFRGRGGFLELGHFDKRLMYDIKKGPAWNKIVVFCPRYSTNCILNENLAHRCTQTGHIFSKIKAIFLQNHGTFFNFQNSVGETFPLSARLTKHFRVKNKLWNVPTIDVKAKSLLIATVTVYLGKTDLEILMFSILTLPCEIYSRVRVGSV